MRHHDKHETMRNMLQTMPLLDSAWDCLALYTTRELGTPFNPIVLAYPEACTEVGCSARRAGGRCSISRLGTFDARFFTWLKYTQPIAGWMSSVCISWFLPFQRYVIGLYMYIVYYK